MVVSACKDRAFGRMPEARWRDLRGDPGSDKGFLPTNLDTTCSFPAQRATIGYVSVASPTKI